MTKYNITDNHYSHFLLLIQTGNTTGRDSFHCCDSSSNFGIKLRKTLLLLENTKIKT